MDNRTLEQCEEAIRHGFAEAGAAFKEIRDRELYKPKYGYGTGGFDTYCREVWQLSRARVDYLIQASGVVDNLLTNGEQVQMPTSERVTRELLGLSPEKQVEVWEEAVKVSPKGKPTAKVVKETRSKILAFPGAAEGQERKELNEKYDKMFEKQEEQKILESQFNEFQIKFASVWRKLVKRYIKQYTYVEMWELAEQMVGRIAPDFPTVEEKERDKAIGIK